LCHISFRNAELPLRMSQRHLDLVIRAQRRCRHRSDRSDFQGTANDGKRTGKRSLARDRWIRTLVPFTSFKRYNILNFSRCSESSGVVGSVQVSQCHSCMYVPSLLPFSIHCHHVIQNRGVNHLDQHGTLAAKLKSTFSILTTTYELALRRRQYG
jgi:hypothetical protein